MKQIELKIVMCENKSLLELQRIIKDKFQAEVKVISATRI